MSKPTLEEVQQEARDYHAVALRERHKLEFLQAQYTKLRGAVGNALLVGAMSHEVKLKLQKALRDQGADI